MKTLIALLKEVPEDTIVASYLDGNPPVTAGKMLEYAENDHELAKQFFSDLLRVSRDYLIHKAKRRANADTQ